MFRIKICGVTSVGDAQMVSDAGADAIGFNFYAESKCHISPEVAREIAAGLPATVCRVGVFVNASSAEVLEISKYVGLDLIQLHGDEPPEFLNQLAGERIVRAFRCRNGFQALHNYLDQCAVQPEAVLIDAFDTAQYGGTGQTLDWTQILAEKPLLGDIPLVLAGGLTPSNVVQAIRQARPSAVDTSSGVETRPGQKDMLLVTDFVELAKSAFAAQTVCHR